MVKIDDLIDISSNQIEYHDISNATAVAATAIGGGDSSDAYDASDIFIVANSIEELPPQYNVIDGLAVANIIEELSSQANTAEFPPAQANRSNIKVCNKKQRPQRNDAFRFYLDDFKAFANQYLDHESDVFDALYNLLEYLQDILRNQVNSREFHRLLRHGVYRK